MPVIHSGKGLLFQVMPPYTLSGNIMHNLNVLAQNLTSVSEMSLANSIKPFIKHFFYCVESENAKQFAWEHLEFSNQQANTLL